MQLNQGGEVNGGRGQVSGLRHSSAPIGRLDRTISSPGLTSKKIDEEVEGVFFPMDGDDKAPNWSGQSPRLIPLRDRSNGDISGGRKNDAAGDENGVKSMWAFRS
jgi:hypothetical protein